MTLGSLGIFGTPASASQGLASQGYAITPQCLYFYTELPLLALGLYKHLTDFNNAHPLLQPSPLLPPPMNHDLPWQFPLL